MEIINDVVLELDSNLSFLPILELKTKKFFEKCSRPRTESKENFKNPTKIATKFQQFKKYINYIVTIP